VSCSAHRLVTGHKLIGRGECRAEDKLRRRLGEDVDRDARPLENHEVTVRRGSFACAIIFDQR
jgi:hypothetical protein